MLHRQLRNVSIPSTSLGTGICTWALQARRIGLDVLIQELPRIQFRTVGRQVDEPDLGLVTLHPPTHRPGSVHWIPVHDQIDLPAPVPDQAPQKVNKHLSVEILPEHPELERGLYAPVREVPEMVIWRMAASKREANPIQGHPAIAGEGLRLCLVIPSLRFGLRYWRYIVSAMLEQGIDVHVVTAMAPRESYGLPVHKGGSGRIIQLCERKDGYDQSLTYISPSIGRLMLSLKPDVIMAVEFTLTTVYGIVASKVLRVPLVIFHEHGADTGVQVGKARLLARRLIGRAAQHFVANTDEAHVDLVENLAVPGHKITNIPLLAPPNREDMLMEPLSLPLPEVRPVFLAVGQLIPRKNLDTLLKATALLVQQGHKFAVWIVGDGRAGEDLRRTSRELGVSPVVTFLGSVPYEALGHIFDAADVFVMPTFRDYKALTVLEALRFGNPVIDSFGDGNAGNSVKHGDNGFLFDPYSPQDLARCMEPFIRDASLAHQMGRRSEEIMRGQTPEAGAEKLYQLLSSGLRVQ